MEPLAAVVELVVDVPAVVVLVALPGTVVVDEVADVDDVAIVLGIVVVAKPVGSSTMKAATALRAAAGGRGMTAPFGRKAIVIISPFSRCIWLAEEDGTIVPLVDVGVGQVSTESTPGLPSQV